MNKQINQIRETEKEIGKKFIEPITFFRLEATLKAQKQEVKNRIDKIDDELNWLKLNKETRIDLLIETGYDKLGGLFYEFNYRIESLTKEKKELEKELKRLNIK